MSVEALVRAGRELVAQLMPDTGRILRDGGSGSIDPVTGVYTEPAATVVHEGPCRVRMPSLQEREVVFGGTQVTEQSFVVTFPHDIPPARIDDNVKIVVSDDPQLLTRNFRVVAVPTLSYLMYRRLGLEAVE